MSFAKGVFRLVGVDGHPHPVLDTPYESMEAAVVAAKKWTSNKSYHQSKDDSPIGIEVMTSNGSWRTILYS